MNFAMQAIGEYKESEQASSLKMRDYKDATDLILRGCSDLDNLKGGDEMKDVSEYRTIVRRLTPL